MNVVNERPGDTAVRPARIWYQSFVDPVEQGPYMRRLQQRLDELAAPGVRYEVHGISPPDRHLSPLTELRCAVRTVHHALQAEAEGCDAFVIGHFQEPGLLECRAAVDIPVIGLGEATMLQACTLGRSFGLVTINPVFIPWHRDQIIRLGCSSARWACAPWTRRWRVTCVPSRTVAPMNRSKPHSRSRRSRWWTPAPRC